METLAQPLLDALYDPARMTDSYREQLYGWVAAYVRRRARDPVPMEKKREQMNMVNPKYVFRNYLAQLSIDRAEQSDFSMIHELLELLRRPYDEQPGKEKFAAKRPDWARNRPGCSMLSCSS